MKTFLLKNDRIKLVLTIVSILSILGISAAYVVAEDTIYIPLVNKQELEPTPTPTLEPTPEPTPEVTVTPSPEGQIWLVITPDSSDKDWALAYFEKSQNDAGRPIMEIYPGDSSPASERIKIPAGETVLAFDEIIRADGGDRFWKLVEYQGREGEDLYLRTEDVTKAGLLNTIIIFN